MPAVGHLGLALGKAAPVVGPWQHRLVWHCFSASFQLHKCMQGKLSASAVALRAALVKQKALQKATLSGLKLSAGCNRTAEMRYTFVVRSCHVAILFLNNASGYPFFPPCPPLYNSDLSLMFYLPLVAAVNQCLFTETMLLNKTACCTEQDSML